MTSLAIDMLSTTISPRAIKDAGYVAVFRYLRNLTPSEGSHTYKVQGNHVAGSSPGSFGASATSPAFILVEDIGT